MKPASVQVSILESAEWYDRSVNWAARFARELPVLCDVFGPPGEGGIIDAGCGTGRHSLALTERGYSVTGMDCSAPMLEVAGSIAAHAETDVRFICCPYDELAKRVRPGFDGLFCLGNALAAAGSETGVRDAVRNFAAVLRPGGRMFIQVLNFPLMRAESPCIRGPRCSTVDGVEYVSVRLFHFASDSAAGRNGRADITNVTLWRDDGWHQHSQSGILYPVTREELTEWCEQAGMKVLDVFGGYDRSPFKSDESIDLILTAEKGL